MVASGTAKKKRFFKSSNLKNNLFVRFTVFPVIFVLFKLLKSLISILPSRLVYLIGRFLGLIVWVSSRRRRLIALRNLEIAFGDHYTPKQRRRIARRSVQHFCLTGLDIFLLPRYWGDKWRQVVNLTDAQEAQLKSLTEYQGSAALQTGHLGSWELASGLASYCNRQISIVYRPLDIPAVDAEVRKLRTSCGHKAYEKQGALKGYMRALKKNEWLGIVADQNAGSRSAFLSFFGTPAATEVSYFPLYLKFNTKVFAVFAIRDGFNFRFHLHGLYEITPDHDADKVEESLRLGQWYNDCIEEVARSHPEQYCWMHKRWRSRPDKTPDLYNKINQPIDRETLRKQPATPIPPKRWQ